MQTQTFVTVVQKRSQLYCVIVPSNIVTYFGVKVKDKMKITINNLTFVGKIQGTGGKHYINIQSNLLRELHINIGSPVKITISYE